MTTIQAAPNSVGRVGIARWGRLVGLVVLVIAVGMWGVLASRGDEHSSQPGIGDVVSLSDGKLRVERAFDVDISMPMTGPGMAMAKGRNVPQIPPGMRRFDVDVTLMATEGVPLWFSGKHFFVTGDGLPPSAPVAIDDGGDLLPAGGALTRTISFQVPERLSSVKLRLEGEPVSVGLGLGPAPPASHHH